MFTLSIVIPAYNEESRLPATLAGLREFISNHVLPCEVVQVLVIDDGSLDGTAQVVRSAQKEWPLIQLHQLDVNRGKGAAVHRGFVESSAQWVLVADADMATPWEELFRLWDHTPTAQLIMGSRGLRESQIEVRQHILRQSMGKTFNFILRTLTGLPYHDTQCGFKLVLNDSVFRASILPRLRVQRFAWDVELILLVQKAQRTIKEVAIRWQHKEASHVRIIIDSFEMLFTVIKLRFMHY